MNIAPDSTEEPFEETTERRKSELVNNSSVVHPAVEKLHDRLFVEKPTVYELEKTVPAKNWSYVFQFAFVLLLSGAFTLCGCCTNPMSLEKNYSANESLNGFSNEYSNTHPEEYPNGYSNEFASVNTTYKPELVLAQSAESETVAQSSPVEKKSRNPLTPIITFFKKESDEDVRGSEKSVRSQSPNKQTQGPQRIPINGQETLNRSKEGTTSFESQNDRSTQSGKNVKKQRRKIQSRPTDSPEIVNLIADLNAAENVNVQQAEQILQELRQYDPSKIPADIYQFNITVVRSKLIPVLEKLEKDEELDDEALLPESLKRTTAQQKLIAQQRSTAQQRSATRSQQTAQQNQVAMQSQTTPRSALKRVPQRQEMDSLNEMDSVPQRNQQTHLQPPRKLQQTQQPRNVDPLQGLFAKDESANAPPAPTPGAKRPSQNLSQNSNVYESLAQEMHEFQTAKQKSEQETALANARQQGIPQGRFAALPEEDGADNEINHNHSSNASYDKTAAKYTRPQSSYGNAYKSNGSEIQQAHYQRPLQEQSAPKINLAGYNSQEMFPKDQKVSNSGSNNSASFRGRSRFSSEPEQPVQEWEYATFSAIQALKQQIAHSNDKEAILADTLKLRLLEATLGIEPDSKHEQFPRTEEAVANYLNEELQVITTILDEKSTQNFNERLSKAQPYLQGASEQLAKLCPLKIRNMQFIKHSGLNPPEADDFLGFGKYTPCKAEFKVDDFAPIYMELENLTVHGNESVGYNIKASFDYEVLDASGNSLIKRSVTPMDDTRKSKSWNVAYMVPIDLLSLPPGHYHVIIRVIDQNHVRLQMDSQRLDFIIRAPTPKK